jgi:hypothetical protein
MSKKQAQHGTVYFCCLPQGTSRTKTSVIAVTINEFLGGRA